MRRRMRQKAHVMQRTCLWKIVGSLKIRCVFAMNRGRLSELMFSWMEQGKHSVWCYWLLRVEILCMFENTLQGFSAIVICSRVKLGIVLQTFVGANDFVFPKSYWITNSAAYPNSTLFRGTNYTSPAWPSTSLLLPTPPSAAASVTPTFLDITKLMLPSSPSSRVVPSLRRPATNVAFEQKIPPNAGNPLKG
ncbi:hypothetical protein F5Y16DRAFT_404199 [Xylariaceae sp. FL0255]|nr:hypothetical protein F5Y16DRAFT_404199 [Xylariaceae sp. FL0255]